MELYKVRSLKSVLLFISVICSATVFIYNIIEVNNENSFGASISKVPVTFTEEKVMKGFLIKTPGCTIPDMNVTDETLEKFIYDEDPIKCYVVKWIPPLFDSNETSFYPLLSSLGAYNESLSKISQCCYRNFYRLPPKDGQSDLQIEYNKTCTKMTTWTTVVTAFEFIKVECRFRDKIFYEDFFHFVPFPPLCSRKRYIENSDREDNKNNKLNVLMVGIDSVSRLNFLRQMPQTVATLRNFSAIELLGYNKVGDNTFLNLIPVLTGLSEPELQGACWQKKENYFDKCPFIWNNYSASSYITAFGEDSSWMGLFYFMRRGFLKQPTDYFYDHFDYGANNVIGKDFRGGVKHCLGKRPKYRVFINYIKNFAKKMAQVNQKYFGFFWDSSLGHDFLNMPKLGDKDFADLMQSFDTSGTLNNTALIVLSDHGIRWGQIRSTFQGRMEERLPFVFIVLPQWYKDQHWAAVNNLRTNTKRLTTPFDLHETLKDLLTNDFDEAAEFGPEIVKRGISLFRKISRMRKCSDAGVDAHWCTCQDSKEMPIDHPDILRVVNFTINEHINRKLVDYANCAQLKLMDILNARQQFNPGQFTGKNIVKDFTVTFVTQPGDAIFEATVRKMTDAADEVSYSITGTVSRINLYGSQSECITDFHLKLYCYCQ